MIYNSMGVVSFSYVFGGTAILIVVGVTLDTAAQIESHMVAKNYEAFMAKAGSQAVAGARGRLVRR